MILLIQILTPQEIDDEQDIENVEDSNKEKENKKIR